MFSIIVFLLLIAGGIYYFKNKSKVDTKVQIVADAVKDTANNITKK